MTTGQEPHAAVGAYVLHALSRAEEAAFENHLAGCDACRREVADLRETAALLGARESVPMPPDARERTLRTVAGTRQDLVRGLPGPRTGRILRPVLAACAALAVALGGIAVWQHGEADDARARADRAEQRADTARAAYAAVLTAPDATLHTAELSEGVTAAVVVSRSEERAVFTAQGLPALTDGKVYELWYAAESGELVPAGLMPGTGEVDGRVMEGSPAGAAAVGITVEPAGGSPQPTSEPLGVVPLTT
ncbi:anti-sigma factor [Streptomyces antibioticus]|uniref:anti-sigma factor n=1 Tax=Streptomyces antibioticus TaxID=1890 RepID=UPI0033B34257